MFTFPPKKLLPPNLMTRKITKVSNFKDQDYVSINFDTKRNPEIRDRTFPPKKLIPPNMMTHRQDNKGEATETFSFKTFKIRMASC